jgi:hypothetical protein
MNFQEKKYLKYKTKYLKKKKEVIYNLYGGVYDKLQMTINNENDTIMELLHNEISANSVTKTVNKYIIITYGPTGSGKTNAKTIGLNCIKDFFEEQLINKDTFIDTGVDDIIYSYSPKNKPGEAPALRIKNQLVKKLKETFSSDLLCDEIQKNEEYGEKRKKQLDTHNAKISKESFDIYSIFRKEADKISDLLLSFAVALGYNIFFETASEDLSYIYKIVSNVKYYGYIPIIIYPYTNNFNLLYDRTLERGFNEGRFISKTGSQFSLDSKLKKLIESFNKLINPNDKNIITNSTNFLILSYNTNFNIDHINNIHTKIHQNTGSCSDTDNLIYNNGYEEINYINILSSDFNNDAPKGNYSL